MPRNFGLDGVAAILQTAAGGASAMRVAALISDPFFAVLADRVGGAHWNMRPGNTPITFHNIKLHGKRSAKLCGRSYFRRGRTRRPRRARGAAELKAYSQIPDILECLAILAGQAGRHREAARLFGAGEKVRQRIGMGRFEVFDADCEASAAALRNALGDQDFETAWYEGASLSTEEAIAYAQRGRGERK
jgi:hypothetical protein